jgi:hypothetical protein
MFTMKRFLWCAAPAALAMMCLGLTDAAPSAGDAPGGPTPVAFAPGKKSAKATHTHHDGHRLLSRAKLKRLPDGVHRVHQTKSGYRLHVITKGGKIKGMKVKDKKGRYVAVQKVRMPWQGRATGFLEAPAAVQIARASFSSEPPASDVVETAQRGRGRCCWRYRCHHPRHGRVIWVYVSWDADSCIGDDDPDRGAAPDDDFDPDGDFDDEGPP